MTKYTQPKPQRSDHPAVWPLVIADMGERHEVGQARYGMPLRPHNGRDALKDAYEEVLDLAAYLRQEIYERQTPEVPARLRVSLTWGGNMGV
jgi:hypothetical protein